MASVTNVASSYLDKIINSLEHNAQVQSLIKCQPLVESLAKNGLISPKRLANFDPVAMSPQAQLLYLLNCLRYQTDDFAAFAELCNSLADSYQHEVLDLLDPFHASYPPLHPPANLFKIPISSNMEILIGGNNGGCVLVTINTPRGWPDSDKVQLTEGQFNGLLNAYNRIIELDRGMLTFCWTMFTINQSNTKLINSLLNYF
jgi:hypothetical protein